MTRRQVVGRLLALLRPMAPLMAVSATARLVNQGLGVAIPALAAVLVVGLAAGSGLTNLIILLAALALVKGAFRYLEQFTGHAVAFRLLAEMRVETHRKLVPLGPDYLADRRSGDLVTRIVADIDRVEPFYAHAIAPLVSAIGVPLLTIAALAVWVDPVVALAFAPFPLLIAIAAPLVGARRVADLATRAREQSGETTAFFTDTIQGTREVAVFSARDAVLDRLARLSRAAGEVRSRLARIGALRSLSIDLLAGGAVFAVAVMGVARLGDGAIDLAALAAAITVAWVGTAPARAVEEIVPSVESALAAAGRVFEVCDREPSRLWPTQTVVRPKDGSVALHGVAVQRGPSPVLEGIEVDLPDGARVAIVGPSGSGKSTLVELLVRFRDPDRGRIEVGGCDVRDIGPSRLRTQVALVPQRPELFFGTIAENLRLAAPDATDDQLWEALDRAALAPWVRSLNGGLGAHVGELGETISGGQRQRLSIARLFLRDPAVVVLDEATSDLDAETERRVLDEVTRFAVDRTLIVVAHRIETITGYDQILVLNRGRLVERGVHDDLVVAGGVYAGLWQRHLDSLVDAR